MTRVDVPERARYAARLMTVVVLPTPPFWLVQAVTLATGTPLRVQMGLFIVPVRPPIRGLVAHYQAPVRVTPAAFAGSLAGPVRPSQKPLFHVQHGTAFSGRLAAEHRLVRPRFRP